MIGGFRFAWARARAARIPLVTLAVVAAVAAALLVGAAGATSATETNEIRAAVASASESASQTVVTSPSSPAPQQLVDAVAGALEHAGVADAALVVVDGSAVIVRADPLRITGSQAPRLAAALSDLDDDAGERLGAAVQVAGGLERTLTSAAAALELRRGPGLVALGILGLVVAVVVGAVATETVRVREGEHRLLRARGARRRSLVSAAAIESLAVATLGAAVGAGLAALVLAITLGLADIAVAVVVALAVGVAAALVAGATTFRAADRGTGRARAAVDIGVAVILAVLTALAAWRFWTTGSPVQRRGDGSVVTDPLVAIAPALVLGFAVLVAVALATPIARLVAAVTARHSGVTPVTPLRLASRRPARHALPIIVVAFAVGATVVTSVFHATLIAQGDAPEQVRVGADVRVSTIPADVEVAEVAALQPADAAMPVRTLASRGTDPRIPILALTSPLAGPVLPDAGGAIDPARIQALLTPAGGVPVPGDTLALTITASDGAEVVEGEPAPPPTAWLRVTFLGEDGTLHPFVFPEEPDGDGRTAPEPISRVIVDVPPGEGWTLVGIDVALGEFTDVVPSFVVADVESGGAPVDVSGFRPGPGTPGTVAAVPEGLEFSPTVVGRDTPWTRAVAPGIPSPMPAVISEGLASALGLAVDDAFAVDVSGTVDADVVIADIVAIVPGSTSGEGLLVDLATFALAGPTQTVADQVWFSSDDPAALAAEVDTAFPQTVTTVADPRAGRNAAATAVTFALAAAGALVLALAVLLLRRSRSRADAREIALFAVLGMGRRAAAGIRGREDAFSVVLGVIGGIVAGWATAWLIVPTLARAAYGNVPAGYPVPLQSTPLALTAILVVVAALAVAIVAVVPAPARLAELLREDE